MDLCFWTDYAIQLSYIAIVSFGSLVPNLKVTKLKTQMHFFSLQTLGGAVAPLNWPRVVHEWQFIVDIEQL